MGLGQHPVMLEEIVRQAGRPGEYARAVAGDAFHGQRVEVRNLPGPAIGAALHAGLQRTAHMRKRHHAAFPVTVTGEPVRDARGRAAVMGERQQFRARRDMQCEQTERPAMQRQRCRAFQRPGKPRRRQREGAGSGEDPHFPGGHSSRQRLADAEPHRVARCQHDGRPWAPCEDRVQRHGQGALPCHALRRSRSGQRQMAFAADQEFRAPDYGAAQGVEAVLADAEHGQPGGHGALSDG